MDQCIQRIVEAAERCLHADELLGDCAEGCRYGNTQMCRDELTRDLMTVVRLLDEQNRTLRRQNYDLKKGRIKA